MGEAEKVVQPWLVELANDVASWFPMLQGRALAVSDASITKENVPTLPLAMLALDRMTVVHNPASSADPEITDNFAVEFWLKNVKYTNGAKETAFWAYHDHVPIRDMLWTRLRQKQHASKGAYLFQFLPMEVGVDTFAVTLTFKFNRIYSWCPIELDAPVPIRITSSVTPAALCEEKPCQ